MDRLRGVTAGIWRICAQANSRIFPCKLTRTLPETFISLPRKFKVPEHPLFLERSFSFERSRFKINSRGEADRRRFMQEAHFEITTVSPFSRPEDAELICGGLFNLVVTRRHDGYARSDFILKPSKKTGSSKVYIKLVEDLSWFFGVLPCAELYLSDKRVIPVWSTHPDSCIHGISDIISQAKKNQELLNRPFPNFVGATIRLRRLKTMRLESFLPLKL